MCFIFVVVVFVFVVIIVVVVGAFVGAFVVVVVVVDIHSYCHLIDSSTALTMVSLRDLQNSFRPLQKYP